MRLRAGVGAPQRAPDVINGMLSELASLMSSSIRSGWLSASSSSRGMGRPVGGRRGASAPVTGVLWVPDQGHTPNRFIVLTPTAAAIHIMARHPEHNLHVNCVQPFSRCSHVCSRAQRGSHMQDVVSGSELAIGACAVGALLCGARRVCSSGGRRIARAPCCWRCLPVQEPLERLGSRRGTLQHRAHSC